MQDQEKPLMHPTSKEEAIKIECRDIATALMRLIVSVDSDNSDDVISESKEIQASIKDARLILDAYGYKFKGEVNG